MGTRETEAKKYLREQRRLDIKDAWKDQIASEGECPRYYGHFDVRSFVFGCFIGAWLLGGIIHFLGK